MSHVSPFITRPKPDTNKRRVIVDLSFPQDFSVNDYVPRGIYMNTVFKLHYPNIDLITHKLSKLGPGCHVYKVDLSRAFRQLFVDPRDLDLLCLYWQDSYFANCRVPFGYRNGSMFLTRFTNYIRYIMRCNSFTIVNYVDDLLGLENLDISDPSFQFLLKILSQSGFPISQSKLAPPSTSCVCLGLLIDTVKETISVPEEKISDILNKCTWALSQKSLSKNNLQSLIGSLMFLHRSVKPTRVFTNRLLNTLRQMGSNPVPVNKHIKQDLQWFLHFVPQYNGSSVYRHIPFSEHQPIELDACLQGLGGRWGSNVYCAPIPDHMKKDNPNITHFELFNVFVALTVWGSQWRGRKLLVHLDNIASVAIVNSGFTKDEKLAAIARDIWMQRAVHDIEIMASHLAGIDNRVADLLSRWDSLSNQWSMLYSLIPEPCWYQVDKDKIVLNLDI